MQRCLLLLVLLLAGSPAFTQTAPPTSRPDSLVAGALAPAAPDTLAAIHKLFATRRQRRRYLVGGTALATVGGMVIVAASTPYDTGSFQGLDRAINTTLIGGIGLGVLGAEFIYYHQYSRKKERQAVDAFQQQKLPEYLRQQLKTNYFH